MPAGWADPADALAVRSMLARAKRLPSDTAQIAKVRNRFACALRGALRFLAVAQGLLADVPNVPSELAQLRDVRLHMIGAEAKFQAMQSGKRQDPTSAFLSEMHALGARSAAAWLADNLDAVGMRSSLELPLFAGPVRNTSTGALAA